jgi:hypothetical protein
LLAFLLPLVELARLEMKSRIYRMLACAAFLLLLLLLQIALARLEMKGKAYERTLHVQILVHNFFADFEKRLACAALLLLLLLWMKAK